MTPLQIKMMLHYYAIAEPYAKDDPDHACSRAVFEQRGFLIRENMIVEDCAADSGYRVSPRGEAYIDALCKMPLPMSVWVMPPPQTEQQIP